MTLRLKLKTKDIELVMPRVPTNLIQILYALDPVCKGWSFDALQQMGEVMKRRFGEYLASILGQDYWTLNNLKYIREGTRGGDAVGTAYFGEYWFSIPEEIRDWFCFAPALRYLFQDLPHSWLYGVNVVALVKMSRLVPDLQEKLSSLTDGTNFNEWRRSCVGGDIESYRQWSDRKRVFADIFDGWSREDLDGIYDSLPCWPDPLYVNSTFVTLWDETSPRNFKRKGLALISPQSPFDERELASEQLRRWVADWNSGKTLWDFCSEADRKYIIEQSECRSREYPCDFSVNVKKPSKDELTIYV